MANTMIIENTEASYNNPNYNQGAYGQAGYAGNGYNGAYNQDYPPNQQYGNGQQYGANANGQPYGYPVQNNQY